MTESNDNFRMAEDPAENATLFAALPRAELEANCLAATKIVAGQIARAEHSVLRANVALRHAAEMEQLASDQRRCLEGILDLLTTQASLTGRTNRRARDEAIASVVRVIREFLAIAAPAALGDLPDIYATTIAPGEPREVPRGN